MTNNNKTIVVKIGTYVLTSEDGRLNGDVVNDLVRQVVELKSQGTRVIMVTSGAVGAGLGLVSIKEGTSDVERRQILASVGQPKLLAAYLEAFGKHQALCAQVLATKEDFRDRWMRRMPCRWAECGGAREAGDKL